LLIGFEKGCLTSFAVMTSHII